MGGAANGAWPVRFCGILGLNARIPQRDVRRIIWAHLTPLDREMVRRAHNSRRRGESRWDYQHLANMCVRYGYVALLDWLYNQNGRALPWKDVSSRLVAAADAGSVPMLQWLKAHYKEWPTSSSTYVVRFMEGEDGELRWRFYDYGNPVVLFSDGRPEREYLAVLRWLDREGVVLDPQSAANAIAAGHMEVLRHLVEHLKEKSNVAQYVAAHRGNTEALEIISRVQQLDRHGIRLVAARANQRHVLEWETAFGRH